MKLLLYHNKVFRLTCVASDVGTVFIWLRHFMGIPPLTQHHTTRKGMYCTVLTFSSLIVAIAFT